MIFNIFSYSASCLFIKKIIYLFIYLFIFWVVLGLHCLTQAFCICRERGLQSSYGVQAFHCDGFSCCRAQPLWVWASVIAACGLSSCGTQA